MGNARDICEHVGVPRLLFSDFPLGNGAGKPHDAESQKLTLEMALNLLVSAKAPRTTFVSNLRWADHDDWKLDYCNVERLSSTQIAQRRADFDAGKAVTRATRNR